MTKDIQVIKDVIITIERLMIHTPTTKDLDYIGERYVNKFASVHDISLIQKFIPEATLHNVEFVSIEVVKIDEGPEGPLARTQNWTLEVVYNVYYTG